MAKRRMMRGRATKLKDVLDCRPAVELPEYCVLAITGLDAQDDEDYEDNPQYMYGDMINSTKFYSTEEQAVEAIKEMSQNTQCVYRILKTYRQFKAIQQEPILQELND